MWDHEINDLFEVFKEVLGKEGIDSDKIEKFGLRNKDPNILNGLRKITFDG